MQEIEAKYVDIDPGQIKTKLKELGAVKQFDRLYQSITFDYADLRLHQHASWVRLRDEGDKVTLAFKQRQGVIKGHNDQGMLEHEIVVNDFATASNILRNIGLIEKFHEEKRRIRWDLAGVEVDIDEMPLIKPYLEVEAATWELVDSTLSKLGLEPSKKKICSAFQLYELAGIRQLDYTVLTFQQQIKRGVAAC